MTATADLLSGIAAFATLDPPLLDELVAASTRRDVARGERLIDEGAQADTLFVVLRGRFVVLKGENPIAEIGPGEPIGELAFLAGGTRTASVVAARDGTVLALDRAAYDRLAVRVPELGRGIQKSLAQRLARSVPAIPTLKPRIGRVCAVLAGNGAGLPAEFLALMRADFAARPDWAVIDDHDPAADPAGGPATIRARIEAAEDRAGHVLLLVADATARPDFADAALAQADSVVLLRETPGDSALSALERRVLAGVLPSSLHLALWRPRRAAITGTAAWLDQRPVALHHHLEAGNPACIARLGRFLRGEALGLVFSGGGAHGCAHLGAVKALLDQGIAPDFLGGTSIGASIAAALAIGYAPEGVLSVFEDIFLRRKAMARYNLPLYAVLDHRLFDQALIEGYLGVNAEDAAINVFAVATSLTSNDMVILRRGPLWQAVRASTSLPAIFPPFVTAQGDVLIDGGLIDNAPVEVMRRLKPGPNLVLNLTAQAPMTCDLPYPRFPGRWDTLQALFRRRARPAPPSLYSVLSNAMVINSRKRLEDVAPEGDLFLSVSVPEGMNFLDWTRGREAFDRAHSHYARRLAAATATDPKARLAQALAEPG